MIQVTKVWWDGEKLMAEPIDPANVYKEDPPSDFIDALKYDVARRDSKRASVAWKLVPTKPTDEMLKAMDECSKEGYDERLYAGHASSVYMAAVDAAPLVRQEPFGYFKAEPFGWTDCAETDEGAIALHEHSRTWTSLTDGEMQTIEETTTCTGDESWLRNLTRNIEAKLKERNQ